jgi:hypothetical protein
MSTDKFTNIAKSPVYTPEKRSDALWTQYEGKHVHGGFLTRAQQISEHRDAEILRTLSPSGFLAVDRSVLAHGDAKIKSGTMVTGVTANDSDLIRIYAPNEQYKALVNGWMITLHNIQANSAPSAFGTDYLAIKLNPSPLALGRFDLVFLEVWREEVVDTDTLYPHGNVQTGTTAITNDIKDSREAQGTVNSAIQIRSRIRVVDGVDYETYPFGIDHTAVVKAQGGAGSVSTYTFANAGASTGDYGLWVAGDGDDTSRTDLNSVDGYSYAIPIAIVRRRNSTAYNLTTNTNGALNQISDGVSDRPDSLYKDQVYISDVLDIRLHANLNARQYSDIMRDWKNAILGSTARMVFGQNDQAGHSDTWGTEVIRVEGISNASDTGVDETLAPDAAQRLFSDESATQTSVGFITNGSDDTDLSQVVSYTFSSKLITLDATQFTVAGALIGTSTPTLKWVSDGTTVVLTGAWTGLGTASATATINVGDGNYQASGQFYIQFDSTLPLAQGLKEVPSSIHKATFNGTDMYVGTTVASLNLTNLASTGAMGISFEYRTRAVTELPRGSPLRQMEMEWRDPLDMCWPPLPESPLVELLLGYPHPKPSTLYMQ